MAATTTTMAANRAAMTRDDAANEDEYAAVSCYVCGANIT